MKQIINTEKAPAAIGPYSQALRGNGLLFVSGQLPTNPETNDFSGSTIELQTKQSFENLKAILEAGNSSLEKVLKTTVFLKDMNDFSAMNEIYQQYFTQNFPARVCIEVARLPKDALVEIEAIALAE